MDHSFRSCGFCMPACLAKNEAYHISLSHLEGARLVQAQEGPRHHMRQALRAVLDDFQDRLPSRRNHNGPSVGRPVGREGGCHVVIGGERKKEEKTPKMIISSNKYQQKRHAWYQLNFKYLYVVFSQKKKKSVLLFFHYTVCTLYHQSIRVSRYVYTDTSYIHTNKTAENKKGLHTGAIPPSAGVVLDYRIGSMLSDR